MTFQVRIESTGSGDYLAECADPQASGRGLSPASALDQLRAELRFQLEICPCHSVGSDQIEFEITKPRL